MTRFRQTLKTERSTRTTKSIDQRLANGIAVAIGSTTKATRGEKTMSQALEGKIALITGGSRGMALQSPSGWQRTERTWPKSARRGQTQTRRAAKEWKAHGERG